MHSYRDNAAAPATALDFLDAVRLVQFVDGTGQIADDSEVACGRRCRCVCNPGDGLENAKHEGISDGKRLMSLIKTIK